MIDIVDIRGKKIVFIDELSRNHVSNILFRPQGPANADDDIHPGFQIDFAFYKKTEKLGERIAY
jgi:hypothetical protein